MTCLFWILTEFSVYQQLMLCQHFVIHKLSRILFLFKRIHLVLPKITVFKTLKENIRLKVNYYYFSTSHFHSKVFLHICRNKRMWQYLFTCVLILAAWLKIEINVCYEIEFSIKVYLWIWTSFARSN